MEFRDSLVFDDFVEPKVLREAREFIPKGMAKSLYINMPVSLRFRFVGEANRRMVSTTGLFRDIFAAWVKYRYIPKASYTSVYELRKAETLVTAIITVHEMTRTRLKEAASAAGISMTILICGLLDRELPSVEQVASSIYHELSPPEQSSVQALMSRNKSDAP